MCVQNLKFVALPIPELIGGSQKIWAVPGYAHGPFSPKFFTGFYSDGPCECINQSWKFVGWPIPKIIMVLKKFGQSRDTPTLPFLPYL